MTKTTTLTTKTAITTDGWYEHTDGSFGYYASRSPGMPRLRIGPCRDYECVHRDDLGSIYRVGWPAREPLRAHLALDGEDSLRGVPAARLAQAISEIKQRAAALAAIEG